MNDGLITAIFGLVGVVVGAVGTGGMQLFLERRRERHAVERAKKLVAGELVQAFAALNGMTVGSSLLTIDAMLSTSAWQTYHPELAMGMSEPVWNVAILVYSQLTLIRAGVANLLAAGEQRVDPGLAETIAAVVTNIGWLRTELGADELPSQASTDGS